MTATSSSSSSVHTRGYASPRDLLGLGPIDIEAVARRLEGMREDERVRFVRALTKADMIRLWDACKGRGVTSTDFVPQSVAPRVEVVHKGKNSLPAFSEFEKRFAHAEGWSGAVYGYNYNPWNWTTAGPGYFVGHLDERVRGQGLAEYGLDYYQVPPAGAGLPPTWPKVRKNEIGLTYFIYAKMVDYMRMVGAGVTIGRAYKHGKRTDNYFVLARTGA